jgi:hypothetical protein
MRSVDGAIGPSFFLELALLWLDLRVLARTDSDLPSHVVVAFGSEKRYDRQFCIALIVTS